MEIDVACNPTLSPGKTAVKKLKLYTKQQDYRSR